MAGRSSEKPVERPSGDGSWTTVLFDLCHKYILYLYLYFLVFLSEEEEEEDRRVGILMCFVVKCNDQYRYAL